MLAISLGIFKAAQILPRPFLAGDAVGQVAKGERELQPVPKPSELCSLWPLSATELP